MGISYKMGSPLNKMFIPTFFRFSNIQVLSWFIRSYCCKDKFIDILDVGCGSGIYSLFFMEEGVRGNYLGVDNSKKFCNKEWKEFSALSGSLKIDFNSIDATQLEGVLTDKFDIVICMAVLEHIKEFSQIIKQISRIVKSNSYILITVPSTYTWLFSLGRHGYHYFSKKTIINELQGNSLEVKKCLKMGGLAGYLFDLNLSWWLSLFYKFKNLDNFFLQVSDKIAGPYTKFLKIMNNIDETFSFPAIGYAYILKKI
jgi:2-polyprenyl-3-methyl-5-hydroxy-6-metoxy-1,4-benzoquinol methylase